MLINSLEDIIAWQYSKELTINIYNLTKGIYDKGFTGQLQRASVSIMNNIAEGFERRSNKEFKQFLYNAKGSCGEVRSMLGILVPLGYATNEQANELITKSIHISKLLAGFIKSLS